MLKIRLEVLNRNTLLFGVLEQTDDLYEMGEYLAPNGIKIASAIMPEIYCNEHITGSPVESIYLRGRVMNMNLKMPTIFTENALEEKRRVLSALYSMFAGASISCTRSGNFYKYQDLITFYVNSDYKEVLLWGCTWLKPQFIGDLYFVSSNGIKIFSKDFIDIETIGGCIKYIWVKGTDTGDSAIRYPIRECVIDSRIEKNRILQSFAEWVESLYLPNFTDEDLITTSIHTFR